MLIREIIENAEMKTLCDWATKASESKGRLKDEDQCNYRTVFQRDRDRILHSKSLRRLMHKTQVFLEPIGDHYRTRLTHSLEVSQAARTVARALRLNEDLAEAIALGHDLGHAPFGHAGEDGLNAVHPGGFKHRVHSLRMVDYLEIRENKHKCERGLNLTLEVRDGILNHSGGTDPFTPEGKIVKFCDRLAYINHDIDDAIRAGIIRRADLPKSFIAMFGDSKSKNIEVMITDLIENSAKYKEIRYSEEVGRGVDEIREYMYKNVYDTPRALEEKLKIKNMIKYLYEYFEKHPDEMPEESFNSYNEIGNEAIKDYIAGMTDRYSVSVFEEIALPKKWGVV